MSYAVTPSQQTRIPMFMWLSHDYQEQFAVQETCLRQRAQTQSYSQDNLFHTILGMLNVTTNEYQPEWDILKGCRDKTA